LRVLIVGGGWTNPRVAKTAEIYSPRTGSFGRVGDMREGRRELNAVRLPDGRVLVAGGRTVDLTSHAGAEILDPDKLAFSPVHSMKDAWIFAAATLLTNGTVVLTGAMEPGKPNQAKGPAEVFDSLSLNFAKRRRYDTTGCPYCHAAEIVIPQAICSSPLSHEREKILQFARATSTPFASRKKS
jgi:hypothetical protein